MNKACRRDQSTSLLKRSCLAVLVAVALSSNAGAQQKSDVTLYAVPAGDLVQAVNEISRNSGVQIVYDIKLLRGVSAAEVKGSLTLEQALDRVLKGTDLTWSRVNQATVSIQRKRTSKKSAPSTKRTDALPPGKEIGQQQPIEDIESVVVVGSRLGTSPVESAMPIKVITRDDIDRSGAGSIAQVLTYLSEVPINNGGDRDISTTVVLEGGNTNSSTVQMRGLPRGTTLILINGRRAGESAMFSDSGQFDLSTIPLSLVERVEVLPAGSSAIYGGDGLAGVVNIVLRRDANGIELRFRKSISDGYDRDTFSALWGRSWSKGSFTFAANWNRNSALLSGERAITADQDFRRFGGSDRRLASGNPTTVYSLAGCPTPPASCSRVPVANRGPLPGLSQPVATVPAGHNGDGLTPTDFLATQGQTQRNSTNRHLISAEQSRGITISGEVEVTPTLELFSELTYTDRTVPAYQVLLSLNGINGTSSGRVAASNPHNPFGVSVGVGYAYSETGLYTGFSQEHVRGLMGIRGKHGRFNWEVTGLQSRDKARSDGPVGFDLVKVAAALAATDPAKALNPFVSNGGAPGSKELLASLLSANLDHDSDSRGDVWTGYIRGPVFTVPAGEVQGLLGFERQRQEILYDSKNSGSIIKFIDGITRSNALFTEFRLPILSPRNGSSLERVALSGALRSESSNRFKDRTQTATLGLEFRPADSLLIRSTYSTAFRPLLAFSAVQDPNARDFYFLDPKFNNQEFVAPGFQTGGVPPDLGPEKSETRTMGLVYRPSSDWSVSLTHWDMKFRDRIAYVDAQTLINNEDYFKERVTRDPLTGLITYLDVRQINISRYDSAGVDIAAEAYFPSAIGEWFAGFSASYTYQYQTQITDASPLEDGVSVRRSEGWAPRWKIVPRLGWEPRDGINTQVVGRYVSRYRDSSPLITGPNAGSYPRLGDFWMLDINADFELSKLLDFGSMLGTRLTFGATNMLNKRPEFCMSCGINGYDSSTYDIVGRTYYAELRMSF